jgi:hydrogenase nickel incorporation protein HypB
MMTTRLLEIRTGVLSKNDQLAASLRRRLQTAGILTLNFVSSPGTGKTAFLERTMREMTAAGMHVSALVGDLETDNDARRLARSGAQVKQIMTHGNCHLEADMIASHLADWDLETIEYLFIENVGNLVCPSSYDLGEDIRVVLLSVTEGEDKPLKYPVMFHSADVAVIAKLDLAEACECDLAAMRANILSVRPEMQIFEVSAKKGSGIQAFIDFVRTARSDGTRPSQSDLRDPSAVPARTALTPALRSAS